MKVILAGYNVDSQVIKEANEKGISKTSLTPEVLSAAYARISRNPAPVNELRKAALAEVEKARKSNRNIIFGMGHHSVAEHAVFNFDILELSRLAIEELEHFRLCSYTEKSQRYITLDNDFVMPAEIKGTKHEDALKSLVSDQKNIYDKLHESLLKELNDKHEDLTKKKSGRMLLDGWAKEDARYATLLCTSGQLGFTANARNLELIIKRLSGSKLEELRSLAKKFHEEGHGVAPSILLFTKPGNFDLKSGPALAALAEKTIKSQETNKKDVTLLSYTQDADKTVAAALLCAQSEHGMDVCKTAVDNMSKEQLTDIFKTALEQIEFFDTPQRELEHVQLTFEICLSAAAYGQLKRHRMMSQSAQKYNPSLGIIIPPSIKNAGFTDIFEAHAHKAEELFYKIKNDNPDAAPYALTNAHKRRVIVTSNLRDLYHFCRLREDAHAQWDIRDIAIKMNEEATKVMPLATMLLSGKDRFVSQYESVFGKKPAIDPANPPKL